MRILHVSRRYAPEIIGGYEYNCQRFSEEWVRRGHDVAVLTRRIAPSVEASTEIGGVRVLRVLSDGPAEEHFNALRGRLYQSRVALANRRNKSATREVLRSWQPDVVVFWGMHPWLMSPIVTVHDCGIPCLFDLGDYWLAEALRMYSCTEQSKRLYRRRVLLGSRFDASMVDSAAVHSDFMRNYYVDAGIDPNGLLVIRRGVDDRLLAVGAERSYTPGQRGVRILCVGRLVTDKGALVLVKAFVSLENQNPGVELHFYGDVEKSYERQVRQECEKDGLLDRKIFIHGAVPAERMPDIYREGDILAFPVLWDEPSSNVLLEAMASGMPIVATRTGSNSEFVRDGETGLLVERGDPEGLHEALARLCDQKEVRMRMGRAGRARVGEDYRQREVYDRTEAWLVTMVSTRPAPSSRG